MPRHARHHAQLAILASSCTLFAATPACADGGADLTRLVNAYRAAPGSCDGQPAAPVGPLAPNPVLAAVRVPPAAFLETALENAGYQAGQAEAINIAGAPDATTAMDLIRRHYCHTLLSNRFSAIGVSRSGDSWQVVFAQPLLPPNLPDPGEAGQAILAAVNAARATPRACGSQQFDAAPPLAWNDALARAALAHSSDMASRRYFSHKGRNGSDAGERARAAGYGWKTIGENIASGQKSAQEAVAGWLESPGHCANIMNRTFTDMGAAYAINTRNVTGMMYWTQVLGRPR